MKLIPCPLNGPRNASEFVYGGEVRDGVGRHAGLAATRASDGEWAAHVFNKRGAPGVKHEWWCHVASGYWFILTRDTLRDEILGAHDPVDWAHVAGTVQGVA